MSQPPLPDPTPASDPGSETLVTLITLGQQLAGADNRASIAQILTGTLKQLLSPDGVAIVLLGEGGHTRQVVHADNYEKIDPAHPLVGSTLNAPLILNQADLARYSPGVPAASWVGAPIKGAAGRAIGTAMLWSAKEEHFRQDQLIVLAAALTSAGIALEHARLLELLSDGKRQWEETVDAVMEAFCVVDETGKVRRANRAFADLTQRPLTTLSGRPWSILLPPAWVPPVMHVLSLQGAASAELPAADRTFTVSALPVGKKNTGAAVLVFADQTDKRRLQEQLVQSEKMSAIGQLIAGVAHDLNNPLASVVGFADYLVESEKDAPPQLLEPLRAIQQEAERAASIVRNLLNFARKQDRRRRSEPIGPILESTLLLLRNQLMACKVEGHLTIDPELPEITLDSNTIQQVFVNLINNAAQAIQPTGELGNIWVRASRWLDGVVVLVEDDGPGIPDSIAGRVFEPFFTTKPDGQGTGLGLSICHGIVTEHGGRITLGKRTGGGASFRVELPGGSQPASQPIAPAVADTGKLRVLVVDDEPHILHYMRATLEAWGHSVELAVDGNDALVRARATDFDVIITDIRMPNRGGRELYEALEREIPAAALRVVFSTGDTVRGDTLSFLESLGRPFLHKPFSLAELRSAIGRTVEKR